MSKSKLVPFKYLSQNSLELTGSLVQDARDHIRCDSLLQKMFNRESFKLSELTSLLGQQLQAPQPYTIEYTVR